MCNARPDRYGRGTTPVHGTGRRSRPGPRLQGCRAEGSRKAGSLNGLLVADNFWCKTDWEVGLKRWQKELADPDAELVLVISPWKKAQKVFVQKRPGVTEELTAELLGVRTFAEHTVMLGTIRGAL